MAVFSLTIPDGQVARLVADVARYRGVDISSMNAAQKLAFMKSDVVAYWRDIMLAQEVPAVRDAAALAAANTRTADIDANLTVT